MCFAIWLAWLLNRTTRLNSRDENGSLLYVFVFLFSYSLHVLLLNGRTRLDAPKRTFVSRTHTNCFLFLIPSFQVPPLKEDPQYQTFDHLMQDFYAQQELESATKVILFAHVRIPCHPALASATRLVACTSIFKGPPFVVSSKTYYMLVDLCVHSNRSVTFVWACSSSSITVMNLALSLSVYVASCCPEWTKKCAATSNVP